MQVVLFCGGQGVRMRDYTKPTDAESFLPKPLVHIGYRPMIWYIMKYYASYGHTDFILALGYKQDLFKEYFLSYKEWLSNDIEINPEEGIIVAKTDIADWTIKLIDTGLDANIGTRLYRVKDHLTGPSFLANYSDGLTDLNLDEYVSSFEGSDYIGSIMTTHPAIQFHTVNADSDGRVFSIDPPRQQNDFLINTGYFLFKTEIFNYIQEGEELVEEPLNRLAKEGLLRSHKHDGFWKNIDSLKDKEYIEQLYNKGESPWITW